MKPATPQTEQTPLTQLRKVVFGGSLEKIVPKERQVELGIAKI
jgi:hypothetical protein